MASISPGALGRQNWKFEFQSNTLKSFNELSFEWDHALGSRKDVDAGGVVVREPAAASISGYFGTNVPEQMKGSGKCGNSTNASPGTCGAKGHCIGFAGGQLDCDLL